MFLRYDVSYQRSTIKMIADLKFLRQLVVNGQEVLARQLTVYN